MAAAVVEPAVPGGRRLGLDPLRSLRRRPCVEEFGKRRLSDVVDAVLRNFHLADRFKRHPLRRLRTVMRRPM